MFLIKRIICPITISTTDLSDCGLLINNSRNIIYSDSSENFNLKVNDKVKSIQADMEVLLKKNNLL